ncbi:MAG: hypothetical protein KF824_10740 [Fimbriimonadaceae bacterium]|nr:MAG: hypothetical protein KF824_10740 [Fimbriimonadaceae bacterium]
MERRFLGFGIAAVSLGVALATVAYSSHFESPGQIIDEVHAVAFHGQRGKAAETKLDAQFARIERIFKANPEAAEVSQSLWYTFDQVVNNYPSPGFILNSVQRLKPIISTASNKQSILKFAIQGVITSQRELAMPLTDSQLDQLLTLMVESQIDQTSTLPLQAMIYGISEVRSDKKALTQINKRLTTAQLSPAQHKAVEAVFSELQPSKMENQYAHVITYQKVEMRKYLSPMFGRRPVAAQILESRP